MKVTIELTVNLELDVQSNSTEDIERANCLVSGKDFVLQSLISGYVSNVPYINFDGDITVTRFIVENKE